MNVKLRPLAPLAVLLGLAACAGQPTIPNNYVDQTWRPDYLNYTAGRGGMFTQVVGNPFDVPQELVDQAVTSSLENRGFGPQMPFFTVPPEDFRSPYRVVVMFNPSEGTSAARLCSEPYQPQNPRAGQVGVLAAFCLEGDRLTSVRGSVAGADGPEHPAFKRLMSQVALLLFPSRPGDVNANEGGGIRRAN